MEAGGRLIALERDERAAAVARRHLAASYEAGTSAERVEIIVDDAMDAIAALPADEPPFDLIFLDADKKRYPEYVDLLLERGLLAPHGLLLADNVLWKGRVLELLAPECAAAADAVDGRERRSLALRDALHGFNVRVAADPRLHGVLLPRATASLCRRLRRLGDGRSPAAAATSCCLPAAGGRHRAGGARRARWRRVAAGPAAPRARAAGARGASSRLARPPGTRRGGWSSAWRRAVASSPATTRRAEPPLTSWCGTSAMPARRPPRRARPACAALLVAVQLTPMAPPRPPHDALAEGPLEYVTLPSLDGDGGVLRAARESIFHQIQFIHLSETPINTPHCSLGVFALSPPPVLPPYPRLTRRHESPSGERGLRRAVRTRPPRARRSAST